MLKQEISKYSGTNGKAPRHRNGGTSRLIGRDPENQKCGVPSRTTPNPAWLNTDDASGMRFSTRGLPREVFSNEFFSSFLGLRSLIFFLELEIYYKRFNGCDRSVKNGK